MYKKQFFSYMFARFRKPNETLFFSYYIISAAINALNFRFAHLNCTYMVLNFDALKLKQKYFRDLTITKI